MLHRLSVVIPVHNSASELRQCLASLAGSETAFECIVVDDGSTDESAATAVQFGVQVLSTGSQRGPAVARNMGAKAATGDILLFIDADVCVHSDTLAKVLEEFAHDAYLDALMGSYDDLPSAQNFISQYRNLMHCFVHQNSKRQATTFWAGCGAIRRQVFLDFGGFDEKYGAPAISFTSATMGCEDIELGYRLSQGGRKLILCPDLQVKHLKRWGVRSMMKADFFYRALPWSELTLQAGKMPNDLNLRISQRISVGVVFILTSLAAYSTLRWHVYFLTPFIASFTILLAYYWIENVTNRSKLVTSLIVVNVALIVGLSYRFHMPAIIPMVLIAFLALFTRHRYAFSRETWRKRTGIMVGGYCLAVIGLVWIYFPWAPIGCVFLLLMLTLLLLNLQFYTFLAGNRGRLFALAAIPFHLLYFASGGAAFAIAVVRHGYYKLLPNRSTPARIEVNPEQIKNRATVR